MAFSKDIYEKYIYDITALLKNGELFPLYEKNILTGANDFKLTQVFTQKNYSTDWIDQLEECITALDTIVRNPRKFIVIEEDIVDISLARSISVESVKHLAQHTNLISSINKEGMVIPAKILNTNKEESYEIYENRFIYTLLLKAKEFLTRRFDAIKSALLESGEIGVDVSSEFLFEGRKVDFKLNSDANFPFESAIKAANGQSNVERLTRITNIFNDFLSSAFVREMRNCALVRPPIQRTNVILKDPNFKKALILWQFIESAEDMNFKIETEKKTFELPEAHRDKFRMLIFLNTVMLQSIASSRDKSDVEAEKQEKRKRPPEELIPDDYPTLKLKLNEVRKIFYKGYSDNLTQVDITKINMAIDRVLRQEKINQEEKDLLYRQKLIEEQLKEEAEAKRLAIREEKERERLRKFAEEEAEKERQLYEKERLEREKKEEEEREIEEKRLKAIAMQDALNEAFELFKKQEEEIMRQLEENRRIRAAEIEEAARIRALEIVAKREEHYLNEKKLALMLMTERNKHMLNDAYEAEIFDLDTKSADKMASLSQVQLYMIRLVNDLHRKEYKKIIEEAAKYMDLDDIMKVRINFDKTDAVDVLNYDTNKKTAKNQDKARKILKDKKKK